MARAPIVPILVAFLFVPAAWAFPVLDDAASGMDAGGSPSTAMPLAQGEYHGNLTPQDTDWFTFPAGPRLGCMDASFLAANAMRVGFGAGSETAVGGLADGEFATTLAIGQVMPLIGALPDEAPWDAASVGPYRFKVSVAAPTLVGDSNQGDAGGTLATARGAPGACFSGHFRGDGSDVDIYKFTLTAAQLVTYSLAVADGPGALARLLDSSGAPIGDPVAAGGIGQALLTQPGEYYLSATSLSSPDGATYALAIALGPEPGGCRPLCYGVT